MKNVVDHSAPLPAHHPRLRSHRYEVTAFGPKDPQTTARRAIAGPFRFDLLSRAKRYAAGLAGDLVVIDYVRPQSSRYPDGPWIRTEVYRVGGR